MKTLMESRKLNKKGNLQIIVPAILTLIFAAVILIFGLVIGQELRDTQDPGTDAFIAANDTVVGLATFADFWEIIVLAVVITVVIGLLLVVFSGSRLR